MAFAGDLQKFPLADVFQSCHQNSMSGALSIKDERGERLIAFNSGYVTACSGLDEGDETLAGELVRRRMVDESAIGKPSRFFKRKGSLKKSLTKRKVLNSAEFNSFTRSVVLERIYDCFLLESGKFEFLEDYDADRIDSDERAAEVKINPNEILMEAMRRIDEWSRIRRSIPSFREVYVATREPTPDDSDLDREILSLTAAGTLNLESMMKKTPAARFECCEAVMALVESGAIRVATVSEYHELGAKAEQAGDLEAAAAFYARGLSYERGNSQLNDRRIALLERLGRKQEAADERKLFAGTLLEKGEKLRAAEEYRKAARLVPADPLPLERLLDLYLEENEQERATTAAKDLTALYLKLGLGENAKQVYPRVLLLEPKNRELREAQAEVHVELHEKEVAANIYKELGQESLGEDQEEDALRCFRRAAELNPADDKVKDLYADLKSGELKARKRRRRVFIAQVVVLLLFCLTVVWTTFEGMGVWHLRRIASTAGSTTFDCPTILDRINTLEPAKAEDRAYYEWTFASRWSKDLARDLAGLYVHEARASESPILPPPPENPLSADEVLERLTRALEPPQEQSLGALVETAEKQLDEGKRAEADGLLQQALARVGEARVALSQSTFSTRRYNDVRKKYYTLRELLPRIYFALGRARIADPEALAVVTAASSEWFEERGLSGTD